MKNFVKFYVPMMLIVPQSFAMEQSDEEQYDMIDLTALEQTPSNKTKDGDGKDELGTEQGCIAQLIRTQITPGIHSHMFNILAGGNKAESEWPLELSGFNVKTGFVSAAHFVPLESRFHQQMDAAVELVKKRLSEKNQKVIFVDCDGVLAKIKVMVKSTKQGFSHVMDIENLVVQPDEKLAFSKLSSGSGSYQKMLDEMIEALMPKSYLPIANNEQKAEIIQRATKMVVGQIDSFEGLEWNYEIVSEHLVGWLKQQQKQGAEFFVLSARPCNQIKERFLKKAYGDIFAKTEFKEKNDKLIHKLGDYTESCSYIYQKHKHDTLSQSPHLQLADDTDHLMIFIDDAIQSMPTYANNVAEFWKWSNYPKEVRSTA